LQLRVRRPPRFAICATFFFVARRTVDTIRRKLGDLHIADLGALSVLSSVARSAAKAAGTVAGLLTFAQGDAARALCCLTMLVVVAMHILGVVEQSFGPRNLPAAMIRGRKRAADSEQSVSLAGNSAIAMLVVLVGFASWYFRGYFTTARDVPYLPFAGPALAMDAQWQHECGSCHLAFHPSLLPARSWEEMLGQQEHFGEDLALDTGVVASLSSFATAHSAERAETPVAWKIASRTPASSTPLRITETSYWKGRHAAVADADWQRVKKIASGFVIWMRNWRRSSPAPSASASLPAIPGATAHESDEGHRPGRVVDVAGEHRRAECCGGSGGRLAEGFRRPRGGQLFRSGGRKLLGAPCDRSEIG
jgi:hypothetical protein